MVLSALLTGGAGRAATADFLALLAGPREAVVSKPPRVLWFSFSLTPSSPPCAWWCACAGTTRVFANPPRPRGRRRPCPPLRGPAVAVAASAWLARTASAAMSAAESGLPSIGAGRTKYICPGRSSSSAPSAGTSASK